MELVDYIRGYLRIMTSAGGIRKECLNMLSVESTGTSRGTQEQYGNMKKFVEGGFFISPSIFKKEVIRKK